MTRCTEDVLRRIVLEVREVTAVAKPVTTSTGLQRGAVGFVSTLFQGTAAAAPAAGIASGLVVATVYAGGSTPLAILLAIVACLLLAVSIGQVAKHLPSAGSLYTYNARALGGHVGFLVGWAYTFAFVLAIPLLALVFGYIAAANLSGHFGWPFWLWAPIAAISVAAAWFLSYRGIRLSTRTSVVLGVLQMSVFLALSLTLVVAAGGKNTMAVFLPSTGNAHGFGSVIAASIFTLLALIGFESGTALGEEARLPRKTIPLAVVVTILLVGFVYLFCYYAATVYFGPGKIADPRQGFAAINGGDPWSALAAMVWGPAALLVTLMVLESSLASANAAANAAGRFIFGMGRIHVIPRLLGTVHPAYRTPGWALHLVAVVGLVIVIGLGFGLGSPQAAFALIGAVLTILVVAAYVTTSISCIVYYLRERRSEFNVILHLLVPAISALAFLAVLVASFGIDFAGLGIQPLTYPASLAPWICVAWLLLGLLRLVSLRRTAPGSLSEMGRIFEEGKTHDESVVSSTPEQ
jgi:amino acid transporter